MTKPRLRIGHAVALALVGLALASCSGGGDGTPTEPDPPTQPPETNRAPSLRITSVTTPVVDGSPVTFILEATDPNADAANQLDRVVLAYGNGVSDSVSVSGGRASAQFTYTYPRNARYGWGAFAYDKQGLQSQPVSGEVEVLAAREISFSATRFFAGTPNAGLGISVRATASGEIFTATTDGSGVATIVVPDGEYRVDFEDTDDHDYHRVNIPFTPTGAACQVNDVADREVVLTVAGDTSYQVETVDADVDMIGYNEGRAPASIAGDGLQRSRAMTANASVPTYTIVMSDHDPALGDQIPPGREWVLPRDTVNAHIFVDALQNAVDRPADMCGRATPWHVELVYAKGLVVLDYLDWDNDLGVITGQNVNTAFVENPLDQNAFSSSIVRRLGVTGDSVWYVLASQQGHGASKPSTFSNEFAGLGFLKETEARCSIRDNETNPGCPEQFNDTVVFFDKDRDWLALDAHFTAIAQLNGSNPWVDTERDP